MITNRISVIVLVLLVTLTLGVFGSGEKEGGTEQVAKNVELTFIGHKVHQAIATNGDGGDIIQPWVEQHDQVRSVEWLTRDIKGIHERVMREASLSSTGIDVAYVLNAFFTQQMANLLTPLDSYLEEEPIENFRDDFSPGMLEALTFDGKLYAIPVRSAASALLWNECLFEERGLDGPPTTPQQLFDYARQLTFTKDNGAKVYGYLQDARPYFTNVLDIARMIGGDADFISPDLEVKADGPAIVQALEEVNAMYREGVLPKDLATIDDPKHQRTAQQGNVGMFTEVAGKVTIYNDPEASSVPGCWKVAPHPIAPELSNEYPVGPGRTEFWSMAIPKNAQNKDISWDYIRYLSSYESQFSMALNGNGPTRMSVYEDEQYQERVPWADVLAQTVGVTRIVLPAFDGSSRARDIIDQYVEQAILGEAPPQEAMDQLVEDLLANFDALHR